MPQSAVVCFYYHRQGPSHVNCGSPLPIELAKDWVKYGNDNYSHLAHHYMVKYNNFVDKKNV